MATQQDYSRLPDVEFRVLIIGRANAGKTSILQRVCDTTESPKIYRRRPGGARYRVQLDPTIQRGQHDINDELIFTNHDGYIFHDSQGFESGSKDELETVQKFVKRKSQEKRLVDRLHAIWYCVPMDNDRPSLDLKYFDAIRPDNNVPVLALFTKYDQFKHDIKMKLEDEGRDPEMDLDAEVEKIFKEHYLEMLNGPPPFVLLEKMHKHGQRCAGLIEMTANTLSVSVVTLMLVAVQKDNLELSIKQAIKWAHVNLGQRKWSSVIEKVIRWTGNGSTEAVIKLCILSFPSIWLWNTRKLDSDFYNLDDFDKFDSMYNDFGRPLFNKLRSFNSDSPLCISSDDTHHTMIASILILDRASLFYASPSCPSREDALDQAYSLYKSSDTHNVVKEQFSLCPEQYSIFQFTEFVLSHRLQ